MIEKIFCPLAAITIEALSLQDLADLGWASPRSSGLSVVGKGELVCLSGREAFGEAVTSYTWSFTSVPPGSQATLDSVNTAIRPLADRSVDYKGNPGDSLFSFCPLQEHNR